MTIIGNIIITFVFNWLAYWFGKQNGETQEFLRFHRILRTLIKESKDTRELDAYSKLDKEHLNSQSK
jgi:hypothetical protein